MRDNTKCVVIPKAVMEGFESLAPATYRASTIVFPDAQSYATRGDRGLDGYSYGLHGTPTTRQLCDKLTDLSGAARCLLTPSGQASNAIAVMALASKGDHVLLADACYPAMRGLAQIDLVRAGVEVEFYDPTSLDDLRARLRRSTKLIWCESPGSTTMEVQDLVGVVEAAKSVGALVGCDNTWATSLLLKPHALGVDIVSEALTKYAGGHSDLLMGSITVARDELAVVVRDYMGRMGIGVSPDDATLVLRGMETMALRMAHVNSTATRLVERFLRHPAVERILWPPLEDCPGHEFWLRDFNGAAGLFTIVLAEGYGGRLNEALDGLKLISIGASWGGTRSLVAPMSINMSRSVQPWEGEDLFLRFSVGLEDAADLEEDVDAFLSRLETGARAGSGPR